MLRKRKLLTIILILFIIFVITTSYLFVILTDQENEMIIYGYHQSFHKLIDQELKKLPKRYKEENVLIKDELIDQFIRNINNNNLRKIDNITKLWTIVNSWISKTTTTTNIIDLSSAHLGEIYYALKYSKIIKADIDRRGTQLKLLLTLQGNQHVVFKPKWYNLNKIINGPVYAGKDRYNGEIIAFYLSVMLHKPLTPFSVERTLSLTKQLKPVASKLLLNTSYNINNNNNNRMCIYGKCFYCMKNDSICEDENYSLTGAVIFNINYNLKTYRSPWQRTYKKQSNKRAAAAARWEEDLDYCNKFVKNKLNHQRLLDLIDTSIFDFLIQNGDRHHYETLFDNILWLDNGKSFGNPYIQHLDILAPLYQCCMLRTNMLEKLERLRGGNLRKRLLLMPDVNNLITNEHLKALEERLLIVFATIQYCKNRNQ